MPTDKGDACRCADGWYNSSFGYVTCHDEGADVDEFSDVPEVLFAAQGTKVGDSGGRYGTQCSKCPGPCATCHDGIVRVSPGYALNPRQAKKNMPLDKVDGMRHVFKCVGNHSDNEVPVQCMGETEKQWDGIVADVYDRTEFMFEACDNSIEPCDKNVWWLCGEHTEWCVDLPKRWCGLGYEGPLCSNCEEGFGRGGIDREANCESCKWLLHGFENQLYGTGLVIATLLLHYLIGWFAVTKDDLAPTKARIGIALVIANEDYGSQRKGWPWVEQAETDAKAIVRKLRLYGYDVVHVVNGTQSDIQKAAESFSNKLLNESKYQQYKQTAPGLAPGEVAAVIVYVGHGCKKNGENCLVPVDHEEGQDRKLVPVKDLIAAARPGKRKGPTICFFDANHAVSRGPMVPMQDGTVKDLYRCPLSKVVMSNPVMLNEDPCESEETLEQYANADKKPGRTPDRGWCYEKSALLNYVRAIKKANGKDAVVGNPRTGEPIECLYDAANDRVTLEISSNEARKQRIMEYTQKSALGKIDRKDLEPETLVIYAAGPNRFSASTQDADSKAYHPGRRGQPCRAYLRNLNVLLKMRRGVDETLNLMGTKVSAETSSLQMPYRVGSLSIRETPYWAEDKEGMPIEEMWDQGFILNGKLPIDPHRKNVQYSMPDEDDEEEIVR